MPYVSDLVLSRSSGSQSTGASPSFFALPERVTRTYAYDAQSLMPRYASATASVFPDSMPSISFAIFCIILAQGYDIFKMFCIQ